MNPESQRASARTETQSELQLPTLALPEGWDSFFPDRTEKSSPATATLLQEHLTRVVLPDFLAKQRWFAAKSDRIDHLAIAWQALWQKKWLLTSVHITLRHAGRQTYSVPLALLWEQHGAETPQVRQGDAAARVTQDGRTGILYDAFADERFCRAVLDAIRQQAQLPLTTLGRLKFSSTSAFAQLAGDDFLQLPAHRASAASSNTTVVLGDRLFLKAYRRLEAGINPEVEMGRFLTEASPYRHIAPLAGTLEFQDAAGTTTTLITLQGCVANQGDAWSHTLDHLSACLQDCTKHPEAIMERGATAHEAAMQKLSTLGRRTGELHCALAKTTGDPAFDPQPITAADLHRWTRQVSLEAAQTLDQLERHQPQLPQTLQHRAQRLLSTRPAVLKSILALQPSTVEAVVTRYHGDFHLGQVLVVQNDFVVIDFEGEPSRTLQERRSKHSPLRDVAGMLRSFSYAAHSALSQASAGHVAAARLLEPFVADWERRARTAFLAAYRKAARDCPALPKDSQATETLLKLFLLEKAFYELRYELDNRPGWIHVPLAGLSELLVPD